MNPEQTIEKILQSALDPILNLTLQDMNIEPSIQMNGSEINIELVAGFPSRFLEEAFAPHLKTLLHNALPQYTCHILIKQAIKAHRTQLPGKGLRDVRNVIAIASGKGGVGKSTISVNLATALAAAGARVGLLDADIYGPSIPLMLGKVPTVEVKDDHYIPVYTHGIQAMSIGYLTSGDDALIWRGPMLAKSLIQLLDITRWQDLDYLLIDLPPGTGDIQLSLVQKIPLTAAIVITTPQQVAALDAQKAIQMFDKTNIYTLGIIENMSDYICKHCHHHEKIFGDGGADKLVDLFQCHLLGQIPFDPRVVQECDQGIPSVLQKTDELSTVLMKTALRSAIELSKRPLNYASKFPPIVAE